MSEHLHLPAWYRLIPSVTLHFLYGNGGQDWFFALGSEVKDKKNNEVVTVV